MSMIILSKEEVERIVNSFDCAEKLTFSDFIDFEPDCKIYKLKDNNGDNFMLICRDYQFDDTDAEERIFANELGITILDRFKYNQDFFFISKNFDDFEYIFSLARIAQWEIFEFFRVNMNVSMNTQVHLEILKLYEKYLLKPVSEFSVQDYNGFEQEMWNLKEKFSYKSSPFLLLPDTAKDADFFMMNASSDGFIEPVLADKQKYLEMMQESYEKLKNELA